MLGRCDFKVRGVSSDLRDLSLRVHVSNSWVLGIWVIVIIEQVWGKYMIIGYLDP